jgi:fatty acid desaturase
MPKDLAASIKPQPRSASKIYFSDRPAGLLRTNIRDLPKPKLDAIRSLHRRNDRRNATRILFFYAFWAAAAYVAVTIDLFAVQALSCVAIICSLVGFSVLLHEASHRLLFERPILNEAIGFLCGLPVLLSVSGFRTNHLAHHERRGSTADIADVGANFRDSTSSVLFYYLSILIRAYGFILYLPLIGLAKGGWKARTKSLAEHGLMAGCCAFVFLQFPAELIVKLWVIPLLISAHLTELRAVAEHGLTTRGNVFTATRTVVSNRCVSFFMCNINYHLEHHLFPALPWYNLPRAHRLLQDEHRQAACSVYRSYTEFFVDFVKASWNGIIPNARLIPAKLREEA